MGFVVEMVIVGGPQTGNRLSRMAQEPAEQMGYPSRQLVRQSE